MNFQTYNSINYFSEGGMAVIYTAFHNAPRVNGMEKKLAIKVIRPEYSQKPMFIESFECEGELLLHLSHPNIVKVYEQLIQNHTCALVMEFMEGPDLEQFLTFKPNGLIPWVDAEHPDLIGCNVKLIAQQVLSALNYAHKQEKPIFHLDIKPANIKIDPEHNLVKILDFGIAAIKDSESSTAKASAGTVEYMPPEQSKGSVDARSDLYAVGFLLYELLTGSLPWKEDENNTIAKRKEEDDFPSPHDINAAVPRQISDAIMRVLKSDPELRPQNVEEFQAILFSDSPITILDSEDGAEGENGAKNGILNRLLTPGQILIIGILIIGGFGFLLVLVMIAMSLE